MKRLLVFLFVFLLVSPGFSYAEGNINVIINGQQLQSDTSPKVVNNTTYVPIRPFFESLGWDVTWYSDQQAAIAAWGNKLMGLGFGLDNNRVMVFLKDKDGRIVTINNAATMINNAVYIPLRSFSELIGADVNWDSNSSTVTLDVTKENMVAQVMVDYFRDGIDLPKNNPQPLPTPIPAPSPAPTPTIPMLTGGVIESRIDGDFNGWEGETIFKLMNGQIWQQASYNYTYHYSYMPEVTIYPTQNGYKMHVDGVDTDIYVTRLK